MKRTQTVFGALLVALGVISSKPAIAGTLVLTASSPEVSSRYKPGTEISSGRIVLAAGEWVQVVSDGKILRIIGPKALNLNQTSKNEESLFARIKASLQPVWQRQERAGPVFGVTRGISSSKLAPDLWLINASRGGTVCFKSETPTKLWRPRHAAAETYTLTRADGAGQSFIWPAAADAVDWPTQLPLKEGHYVLRGPDKIARDIEMRWVGGNLSGPELLAVFGESGCMTQLERAATELPE